MDASPDDLKHAALERVRHEYEVAAGMKRTDLDLVNRVRDPAARYGSVDELVCEWFGRAGAVSAFAVSLGLITSKQALQVIREVRGAHPDLAGG